MTNNLTGKTHYSPSKPTQSQIRGRIPVAELWRRHPFSPLQSTSQVRATCRFTTMSTRTLKVRITVSRGLSITTKVKVRAEVRSSNAIAYLYSRIQARSTSSSSIRLVARSRLQRSSQELSAWQSTKTTLFTLALSKATKTYRSYRITIRLCLELKAILWAKFRSKTSKVFSHRSQTVSFKRISSKAA